MKVKIALAADTILYLPMYCLEKVHRPPGVEIYLDEQPPGRQLGDQGAYRKVQLGEADFCVCDPMVVLREQQANGSTIGVVVASLVSRAGLWALRTPTFPLRWGSDASLFDELAQHPNVKVHSIVTYDQASTAAQMVNYILTSKNNIVATNCDAQKSCVFGQELRYLTHSLPPPDQDVWPEIVVTCDLVGALAAQQYSDILWPAIPDGIGIALDFPSRPEFQDMLFTGLIAHRGFLRNNRELTIEIVSALQEVLTSFHENARLRWSMAEMISGKNHLFPGLRALFPDKNESENFAQQSAFCGQAVERLNKSRVLATTVRVSKKHWDRQAEVCQMLKGKSKNDPYSYSSCSDRSIAAAAHPPTLIRQARSFRRFLIPVFLPIALMVETFHGIAGFYHLYDLKPNSFFWIMLFSIWGGVVIFLVTLGLSKKHT